MSQEEKKPLNIHFIGIGSAKSATTWVGECLKEHPQILFSQQKTRKELRFFNTGGDADYPKNNICNFNKGIDWYLSQFPEYEPGKIRGEFSINYLTDPEAAQRIKDILPKAKIIVCLRNPADMIYSLHWMRVATVDDDIPVDFTEALEKGYHKDKGLYYKHLLKFYDLFPPERIHVIIYDDIKRDPIAVIRDLYKFLEVDQEFRPSIVSQIVNKSTASKSKSVQRTASVFLDMLKKFRMQSLAKKITGFAPLYDLYMRFNIQRTTHPPMSSDVRGSLVEYYEGDISSLEGLIKRDLSEWRAI